MDIFAEAVAFAARAHANTFRKGTHIPFLLHPLEAASIAVTITGDPEILAAVVLHDTVEDTDTTAEDLRSRFGSRVAALVAADSENKRPEQEEEQTWLLRKQESLQQMAKATRDEQILILADKLSNMRALTRDFREIGEKLWERFNNTDPALQLGYYKAVGACCKDLRESDAYIEYMQLIQDLAARNCVRPETDVLIMPTA